MHRTTKAVLIGAAISMLSVAASGTALAQSQDDGVRTVKSLTADREGPGTKSVDPKDKDRKDRKPKGQDSKDKGSKDKSPKDRDDEQPIIIVPACVLNQVGSQQAASDQANAANDNESSTVTQANASEIQQALGQSQSGTCNFIINLVAAEEELVNP